MLALIQEELAQQEGTRDEGVTSLLYLLQSPLFTQLLKIQDSLTQLKEVKYYQVLDRFNVNAHVQMRLLFTGVSRGVRTYRSAFSVHM